VRVILAILFLWVLLCSSGAFAQSPNGSIRGIVLDPDAKSIPGAEVIVVNDATGVKYVTATNGEGIYAVENLPPGPYRIQVSKFGFKGIIKPDLILNVQDALSLNFTLPIGASSVTVTVEGGAPMIDTTDATVSTVVDRQFAENLPLNGRSFQSLIEMTPGVVLTPSTPNDGGQFSVNGQRAAANYWMVDGVGANIGIAAGNTQGNGFGGTLGSFSAMGGTNSLVSVDAMQEFRIQTSTFAPEFGRTPGAQISIVTRSGANQFHGTLFEYLRNDLFDASNWFNGYTNNPPLAKAEERQNDFGGTFSGPIRKDKIFFFFSYEGLRLRLPQTTLTTVPDLAARQNSVEAMRPYLNAFPLPNGTDNQADGVAQFNASYSNPASLDAYSLRIDDKLTSQWSLFGRYNYSPSKFVDRGGIGGAAALSTIVPFNITTQTATAGATWAVSPTVANDLRFNYSRTDSKSFSYMDNFGGAVPLTNLPFPGPLTPQSGLLVMNILGLTQGNALQVGPQAHNVQQQINLVESLSWQRGSHGFKIGVDYRRLSPVSTPPVYEQLAFFLNVPRAEMGHASAADVYSYNGVNLLFRNLGVFAQDTWRVSSRLTLTYGLRWDVDFTPSALNGPNIPAVTGYSLTDFSHLAVAPAGTEPFATAFGSVAPRFGAAYQISRGQGWESVLRGGMGVFYDLVSSEAGNLIGLQAPPFATSNIFFRPIFPLTPSQITAPAIPSTGSLSRLIAFNPNLKLPYTLEWNLAFEQSVGKDQSICLTYVGASGRRLIQSTAVSSPPTNPDLQVGYFIDNTSSSNYNALQLQFRRRLSRGLQALASYTWSHSIDNASAGSVGTFSNYGLPGSNANRGDSDFDIRNGFTLGLTYDLPAVRVNRAVSAILRGWSTETFVLAHSASPVDLGDVNFFEFQGNVETNVRPDIVAGQSLYLHGAEFPGGKALNPAAFSDPPVDPNTGNPTRQGSLGRNALRGFGATQWDLAVHREFPIRESLKLQFRTEMFNLLNHPNFGPPNSQFGAGGFGLASQTLSESLSSGSLGSGGFNPLYQIGGPRSVQFALKLLF
jgi:Carboxypeptidase regulatory-like domain/TonB dependent receptor